jgi:tRNA A37 methylthiotransferase MiaB
MDKGLPLHYTYFCPIVKAMKILLIQPPVQDFYQTSIRTQPLGLAYLAASLQNEGHEVEILDCREGAKKSIPLPRELSYLREFYPGEDRSPFKLYSGYYHFGIGWDEIKRRVEASGADLFGISSSFTPYHGEALEVARIINERDGKKIVVMGGAHVSCDPEGVLSSPFVDYVVLGEGEIRFPRLIEEIGKGREGTPEKLEGIGFRKDGKVLIQPLRRFIRDLDSLPFPARGLLDLNRYRLGRKRSTMILTSRGCPHRCAYCSGHLVTGTAFRKRSPEAILQEMKECRERYGIEVFDIEDDNFTFDTNRAKRLMELIVQAFGERKLELTAMNGVSFASLDGELLEWMRKAGFDTINLSFVSADTDVKERMARPAPPIDFDEILRKAEGVGLNVVAYAIFGMPGQTIEEMVDTLVYLMERKVLIGPSIYYPSPGTPLFDACRGMGFLPPHQRQWRSSAFPVETGDFSRLDMVSLFRLTRVINFVKSRMDEGDLAEGMILKDLFRLNPLSPLFEKRAFFGLRKDGQGRTSAFDLASSKKVLDCFFERGRERSIRGSRASCFP